MLNYLKSEAMRLKKDRGVQMFLVFNIAVVILFTFMVNDQSNLFIGGRKSIRNLFDLEIDLLPFLVILFVALFASFNSKDKGIHIQMISTGMKRWQVFFGEYIMNLVLAIIFMVIVSVFTIICGMVVLDAPEEPLELLIKKYYRELSIIYIEFMAFSAIAISMMYIFKSRAVAVTLLILLTVCANPTLSILEYRYDWAKDLIKALPMHYINSVLRNNDKLHEFILCVIGNIVFYLTLGMVMYKRKEY